MLPTTATPAPPLPPLPRASMASALTLSAVMLWCKSFLGTTTTVRVEGQEHLMAALKSGRGVVTVCNHNSVVDDPFMWSILPLSTYLPPRLDTCLGNRWTLGASDIMFTNPVMGKFFELGQVISTERGKGIYQPAVDLAIRRVEEGGWVHIFPEGRVNQEKKNPLGGLHRFKWGVGRIVMDSKILPEVIPIWISGFDQIMNEDRTFPRFIPRPGANISITIGESLTPRIAPLIAAHKATSTDPSKLAQRLNAAADARARGDDPDMDTRIAVTAALQAGVREIGERVEEAEGRFARGTWTQSRRKGEKEAQLEEIVQKREEEL